MEEYLTISEVCQKTKLAPQTVYNYIYRNVWIEGLHYFKPSHKVLRFKWEAIRQWMECPRPKTHTKNGENLLIDNQSTKKDAVEPKDKFKSKTRPRRDTTNAIKI